MEHDMRWMLIMNVEPEAARIAAETMDMAETTATNKWEATWQSEKMSRRGR